MNPGREGASSKPGRAASIRARLKNHADATKDDFNLVLTRYGIERLLYRLAISEHASRFVLKGALLFALWYGQPHRPTRDADLLGFGPDDPAALADVFASLCGMEVDDGLVFDPASVRVAPIREEARYGGVRVDLRAVLDAARLSLQVDVGFGDVVTPAPLSAIYPSLLPDLPTAPLRIYPKATVVAEKLHAICLLGMANSRMKDYFDLDQLLQDPEVDEGELRRAIAATFERRQMALPHELPVGLGETFATDALKRTQWAAFLRRNRLAAGTLEETLRRIRERAEKVGIPGASKSTP